MRQSARFTTFGPSIPILMTMIASFALLSYSTRTLPLGTAYTIWTGVGAVGAFMGGILTLGEHATTMRIVAALLILSGLVTMQLSGSH